MTFARFAFVVCLAGLLISLMVWAVLLLVYVRGASLQHVLTAMHPVLKLGAVLLVLAAAASLVLAAIHRLKRRKNDKLARALRIVAAISIAVGATCALYQVSDIKNVLWDVEPVNFGPKAPYWADSALVLALGFLPAVIALLGAAPVRVERRGL